MAEPHVITALVRKRAELAGNLARLDTQRRQTKDRIRNVDRTLMEFGYGGDPAAIQPRVRHQQRFKRHELRRLIADILRDADKPLSHRQVAQIIIKAKGWDLADTDLRQRVTDGVRRARRQHLLAAAGDG